MRKTVIAKPITREDFAEAVKKLTAWAPAPDPEVVKLMREGALAYVRMEEVAAQVARAEAAAQQAEEEAAADRAEHRARVLPEGVDPGKHGS